MENNQNRIRSINWQLHWTEMGKRHSEQGLTINDTLHLIGADAKRMAIETPELRDEILAALKEFVSRFVEEVKNLVRDSGRN